MPIKYYLYLGGTLLGCAAISYHFVYITNLKTKINHLEVESIKTQHSLIACKTNLTELEKILNKQNKKLQDIGNEVENNLNNIKIWQNKKEEDKYNKSIINIFNSHTVEEITKKLNELDFNKDL